MLLITAATEQELDPILQTLVGVNSNFLTLMTGVGLLEAAATCTAFLGSTTGKKITMVVNAGVAGAFVGAGVKLLDICLAEQEVVGDFGINLGDEIGNFEQFQPFSYLVDQKVMGSVSAFLADDEIPSVQGNFVSVNAVSASTARGNFLRDRHKAICENMEGAAVARACLEYGIPFVEVRCVSNMVEDRDLSQWKMAEAIGRLATVMGTLLPRMINHF